MLKLAKNSPTHVDQNSWRCEYCCDHVICDYTVEIINSYTSRKFLLLDIFELVLLQIDKKRKAGTSRTGSLG
jgi:hypothetical protein